MLGWFRDEIARASRSKAGVELLESGFNGDGTAYSRDLRKCFAKSATAWV
jgi:hypothetical protein